MKIDIYSHLIPPKLKDLMFQKQKTIRELQTNLSLHDLDTRFRIMDRYPDLVQVLTVPGATPDELAGPDGAVDLSKKINDEMAELVDKHPYRFAGGVAVLPMSNIEASLKEIDRAIKELKLRGILLRIPIGGKPVDRPEFFPVYEKMCQLNLPIWFHPHKNPRVPDYPDEAESKYLIWHLWGLVVESTYSMTRLVLSGVLEKYPKLKIIIHHCGAMVPYFSERIVNHYHQSEMRNKTNFTVDLAEPVADYFRRFYTDTALIGNTPALMCAHSFFGPDRILFGTDSPFDSQLGDYGTKRTIEAVEQMAISEEDKKKIFENNARKLLRLPV
ncbi:MAG TPA: amidohydrolase family protein [Thermodesulfobacteriota bacterium]|nr:amidohydrolase family protein [Thermodesulfobacteriota bacterium]